MHAPRFGATRTRMPYTVMQAGKATGKAKTTILRAIQTGKVSANRDPVTQAWIIDPAELHRVYPTASIAPPERVRTGEMANDASARRELELVREEREREREEAQRTIEDLRRRLDRETEERREAQARLTALLSGGTGAPVRSGRGWWPWRRG